MVFDIVHSFNRKTLIGIPSSLNSISLNPRVRAVLEIILFVNVFLKLIFAALQQKHFLHTKGISLEEQQ